MSDNNILNLAKKLKALADQGVGGEKTNAAEMLDRLCRKHGISMEDLDEDKLTQRKFHIMKEQEHFFSQVVFSVVDRDTKIFGYRRPSLEPKRGWVTFFIDLRDCDYLEIEAKFDFYWTKYQEDLKLFYRAFVHRNNLGAKPSGEAKPLTPEERAELCKVMNMAEGMEGHTMMKRLTH